MRKDYFCCCSSLSLRRDTLRFPLLGVLIALYMLAGAAVFSAIERPAELQGHVLWAETVREFRKNHNVSHDQLKFLLKRYEKARRAGIRSERSRDLWDFTGAFYFVGTLVSTIGFGVSAPTTFTGKVFLIFYGLLGCSGTLLFFNIFLEKVITSLGLLIARCHRRRTRHNSLEGREDQGRGNEAPKPPVYLVTLILLCAVLVVACAAATMYSVMEGWSYFEALYFCFVAFSTVGFGDFVSNQREHHQDNLAYQIANCLLMLLGLCCTYSLLNTVSEFINQAFNWLLSSMDRMNRSICHSTPQPVAAGQ